MKYLLIAVLFLANNAGAQTVGELRFDSVKAYVTGPYTEIIKFKSYAEQQAFYRNYGHMITGFDSSMLCKHIYVAVEPEQVESWGVFLGATITKDIVCIKCFHETKQIIIQNMRTMPDTIKLWRNYPPPMNPLRQ